MCCVCLYKNYLPTHTHTYIHTCIIKILCPFNIRRKWRVKATKHKHKSNKNRHIPVASESGSRKWVNGSYCMLTISFLLLFSYSKVCTTLWHTRTYRQTLCHRKTKTRNMTWHGMDRWMAGWMHEWNDIILKYGFPFCCWYLLLLLLTNSTWNVAE